LKEKVKGALGFALLVAVLVGGWKFVEEYRYYQVVKKEHQEFFMAPLGQTPEGRTFTRKQFFDAMVAETARMQAEKAKSARKE